MSEKNGGEEYRYKRDKFWGGGKGKKKIKRVSWAGVGEYSMGGRVMGWGVGRCGEQ